MNRFSLGIQVWSYLFLLVLLGGVILPLPTHARIPSVLEEWFTNRQAFSNGNTENPATPTPTTTAPSTGNLTCPEGTTELTQCSPNNGCNDRVYSDTLLPGQTKRYCAKITYPAARISFASISLDQLCSSTSIKVTPPEGSGLAIDDQSSFFAENPGSGYFAEPPNSLPAGIYLIDIFAANEYRNPELCSGMRILVDAWAVPAQNGEVSQGNSPSLAPLAATIQSAVFKPAFSYVVGLFPSLGPAGIGGLLLALLLTCGGITWGILVAAKKRRKSNHENL